MRDQLRESEQGMWSAVSLSEPGCLQRMLSLENHVPPSTNKGIKGSLSSDWVRAGIWLYLFPSLKRGTGRKPCCEICQGSKEPDLSQGISLSSLSGQRWCSRTPHPSPDLPSLAGLIGQSWRAIPKAVGSQAELSPPQGPRALLCQQGDDVGLALFLDDTWPHHIPISSTKAEHLAHPLTHIPSCV